MSPGVTRPPGERSGGEGERLAAEYLEQLGYRIEASNVRAGGGEIDLIAYDGNVLCFVEVRSLTSAEHGDPLETISPLKIRRVVNAAQAYLADLPAPWPPMRFDAVGVVLTQPPQIRLVRDAFEA